LNFKLLFVLLLLVGLISCSESSEESENSISLNTDSWEAYLEYLQVKKGLDNHLLLFVYPTYCGDCLLEMNDWNRYLREIKSDVSLVVVERYASNVTTFAERNNYNFQLYADTLAKVLNDSLIPSLPYRVYFNSREIELAGIIGDGYNVQDFFKRN